MYVFIYQIDIYRQKKIS